ncbi:MAG: choice-of-anchor tandem repeat GloVer-containing protein [Rhodospirillales bacterium]
MVADASGALYGTTTLGGYHGEGAIFKLTPPAAGQTAWTETVLYSFTGGTDGGHRRQPRPARCLGRALRRHRHRRRPVLLARHRLRRRVQADAPPPPARPHGPKRSCTPSPAPTAPRARACPAAGLVAGPDGVLYGSVYFGGKSDNGTVFEITP